ncbi:hypothetical protein Ancab_007428 [Ancistrocladus abbreviatus]
MAFVIVSSDYDCIDACTTGCVSLDPEVVVRQERKCSIKCAPPAAEASVQPHVGRVGLGSLEWQ